MRYWIYWNELTQGPFELEELVSLRAFSEDLLVCMENRQDWIPASRVADLAPSLELLKSRAVPPPPPPPPPSRPPSTTPLQGEFFGESPGQQHLFESEDKGKGPYAFAPALDAEPAGDYGLTATVTMPIRFMTFVKAPEQAPEISLPAREPIAFPKEPRVDFVVPPMIRESPAPAPIDVPASQPVIDPPPKPAVRRVSPIFLEELRDESFGSSRESKLGLLPWVLGVFLFVGLVGTGGYWVMDHYTSTSALDEVNQHMTGSSSDNFTGTPPTNTAKSPSIPLFQRGKPDTTQHGLIGGLWQAMLNSIPGMHDANSSVANAPGSAAENVSSVVGANEATAGVGSGQTNFGSTANSPPNASTNQRGGMISNLWQAMLGSLPGIHSANSSAAKVPASAGVAADGSVTPVSNKSDSLVDNAGQALPGGLPDVSAGGSATGNTSSAVGTNEAAAGIGSGQTNSGSTANGQPSASGNQRGGMISNLWQTMLNALPGMHKVSSSAANVPASAATVSENGIPAGTSVASIGSAAANATSVADANGTSASAAHGASWTQQPVSAMQQLAAQPTPVGKVVGALLRFFGLAKPIGPSPLPVSSFPAAVPGMSGFGFPSVSPGVLAAGQKPESRASGAVGKKRLARVRSAQATAKKKSGSALTGSSADAGSGGVTAGSLDSQADRPAPDTVPGVAAMKTKTVAVGAAAVPGLSPAAMNVTSVPGKPDPWAGRYAEAMRIVQGRTIFSGRRTIGNQAKQMLAEMHEKELLHAADTGERLYLPDKMGWSALHQDGPMYRVYLNFSALQADGNRVQARSYQFLVNLENHDVSSDDTATLQDFLENAVFTVYHHNPMTDDIESVLSAVDQLNKQKMRAMIVEKGRRSSDEQKNIHQAFVKAHDKLRREIIYFRTKYIEKILANIAKAYLFPELIKANG